MTTVAGAGGMSPQAKKQTGPLETRTGQGRPSSRSFSGKVALQHLTLDFWLPELYEYELLLG